MQKTHILIVLTALLLGLHISSIAKVIYVNGAHPTSNGDGSSWDSPFQTIEAAIAAADEGDDIWIAKGEYSPPAGGEGQDADYVIGKTLSIYGGFSGVENTVNERDLMANKTILTNPENNTTNGNIFVLRKNIEFIVDGLVFTNYKGIAINQYGEDFDNDIDVCIAKVNNCSFVEGIRPINFYGRADLEIKNSVFDNNLLPIFVSSISEQPSSLLIEHSEFKNYTNQLLSTFNISFEIISSVFRDNRDVAPYLSTSGNSSLKILSSQFYDNDNVQLVYVGGSGANNTQVLISGSDFYNNSGSSQLLQLYSCSATIQETHFENNNAPLINTGSADMIINNCRIQNNTSLNHRLVNIQGTSSGNSMHSISNCSVKSNTASIGVLNISGDLLIEECTFENNVSSTVGCLYIFGYTAINNSLFVNNKSIDAGSNSGDGGAINSSGGRGLLITNCSFMNNTSEGSGGALFSNTSGVSKNVEIKNSIFLNNSSARSGGSATLVGSTFFIVDCLFENNESGSDGGAVYGTSTCEISKSNFLNNRSQGRGGVLYTNSGLTIDRSIFENNKSLNSSGGCFEGMGINFNVTNSIFINNTSKGYGGIIASQYGWSSLGVRNSIFYGNSSLDHDITELFSISTYGGITSPNLYNSILWNNGSGTPYFSPNPNITITHSNIQGGAPGEGNMSVDPMFVDPENGDFRLSCNSPLINSGANQFAPDGTDLDGNPRIFGGTVDMGAYEFQADPSLSGIPAQVAFAPNATNVCVGETIQFSNTTPNTDSYTYDWSFGDDSPIAATKEASHAYSQPGTYTITLTAYNLCGRPASTTQTIEVIPSFAPSITGATSICPNEIRAFSTNVACTALEWSVIGGEIIEGQGTANLQVQFADGSDGNASVSLLATGCGTGTCEIPVTVQIPIVPVHFSLEGNTEVCQGGTERYEISRTDPSPGTIYTWSAENGTIVGSASDYSLKAVDVQWSTTATSGTLYLETYNELLGCGEKRELEVVLRPKFTISGTASVCAGTQHSYGTSQTGDFVWEVNGDQNANNASVVTWGEVPGTYTLQATSQNANAFCNLSNSFAIQVFAVPTIETIEGETAITAGQTYAYLAVTDLPQSTITWQVQGGTILQQFGKTANIRWNEEGPYSVTSIAKAANDCSSQAFIRTVEKDIAYSIQGAETFCIDELGQFTVEASPALMGTEIFQWSVNGENIADATNAELTIAWEKAGLTIVRCQIQREDRVYLIEKQVQINAASVHLGITGERMIDPLGTGTYTYTVSNPSNSAFVYEVIGAANHNRVGNNITITWGGTAPFEIKVVGTPVGATCPGIPVVFEVEKIAPLNITLTAIQGANCHNEEVTYRVNTDRYANNLVWSLSSGGEITAQTENTVTVKWTATGSHSLTLNYDRFGAANHTETIVVNAPSIVSIPEVVICEGEGIRLNTGQFIAYEWTKEEDGSFYSTEASPLVYTEGVYKVRVTNQHGCKSIASRYIRSIPSPIASVNTRDQLSYTVNAQTLNKNITVQTPTGTGYQSVWYVNGQASPITGANFSFTISLNAPNTQEVKVITTRDGCVSEDSKIFRVIAPSTGGGGTGGGGGGQTCTDPDVSFMIGSECQPYTITNTSPATAGSAWNFGDGTPTIFAANPPEKEYTEPGIYRITLTRGCKSVSEPIDVPFVADFSLKNIPCSFREVFFEDFSTSFLATMEKWEWDLGDGTQRVFEGAMPFDFSHTYNTPGYYNIKLTVSGTPNEGNYCGHSVTKQIKVEEAPRLDFDIIQPACTDNLYRFVPSVVSNSSEVTYYWSDTPYSFQSRAEQLVYRFTDYGEKTINLSATDLNGCIGGVSHTFNVPEPVTKQPITFVGEEKTRLCNNQTVTLQAPSSINNSYVWKNGTTTLPTTTRNLSVAAPGKYTVAYAGTNCVITTDTLYISAFNPNYTITGAANVCETENTHLSLGNSINANLYNIAWKKDGELLNHNRSVYNLNNLQIDQAGTYTVTLTEKESGCEADLLPFELTVHSKPAKPAISIDKQAVCYGDALQLTYDDPLPAMQLNWTANQISTGLTTPVATLNNINYNAFVRIGLTIEDENTGCKAVSDETQILVAPPITFDITGETEKCTGEHVFITSNLNSNDYSFEWYKNGELLPAFTSDRIDFPTVVLSDQGTYHAIATSKGTSNITGCSKQSNPITLQLKAAPPIPQISGGNAICTGNSITLSSSVTDNIVWNTGSTSPSIEVNLGGIYSVTATSPVTGCVVTRSQTVTQNPLPHFNFVPLGTYEKCSNEGISFRGLINYPEYQWRLNGQAFGAPNEPLYATESGVYTLRAVTDKGCVGVSGEVVIVSKDCPCYVTNTDDSGDGSLRDAIICANTKPGRDNIRFFIEGEGPHIIQPLSALPTITEQVDINAFSQSGQGIYDVVIDGSQYAERGLRFDFNVDNSIVRGLEWRNFDRAIVLRTLVDRTQILQNRFYSINDAAIVLENNTKQNTIQQNHFEDGKVAVHLSAQSENNQVRQNTVTDYQTAVELRNGAIQNTVYKNRIENITLQGVRMLSGAENNLVKSNEFLNIAGRAIEIEALANANRIDSNYIGVNKEGVVMPVQSEGVFVNGANGTRITRNTIAGVQSDAIRVMSSTGTEIDHNTIGYNAQGTMLGNTGNGVYTEGGTTLKENRIAGNSQYGVYVAGTSLLQNNHIENNLSGGVYVVDDQVKISKSTFVNTNTSLKAIDLHGVANQNKQAATFEHYQRTDNGLLLTGQSQPEDSIQIFISTNQVQQALEYVASAKANAQGNWQIEIVEGNGFDPNAKNYYVNTASSGNRTSELSLPYSVACFNCVCLVENNLDAGEKSFRAAVDSAHTGTCLIIQFALNNPDSIQLISPIRPIEVPVDIQGTQLSGVPTITLKGNASITGLEFNADGAKISGLHLKEWQKAIEINANKVVVSQNEITHAVRTLEVNGNENLISQNCLNCRANQSIVFSTDTAVVIRGNNNEVGLVGKPNTIVNATGAAINVYKGVNNRILYNTIRQNAIAIHHSENGNQNYPAPTDLVGILQEKEGLITGKAQSGDRIQVFASNYLPEQAISFVLEQTVSGTDFSIVIPEQFMLPNENTFFVLTATSASGNTSPLTAPIKIGDFPMVCWVTNTKNTGEGSLRAAVDCANEAGSGEGNSAMIRFDLPAGQVNTIKVKNEGFTITNTFGVAIDAQNLNVNVSTDQQLAYAFRWSTPSFVVKNITFQAFQTALLGSGTASVIENNRFIDNRVAVSLSGSGNAIVDRVNGNNFSGGTIGIYAENTYLLASNNHIGINNNNQPVNGTGILVTNALTANLSSNQIRTEDHTGAYTWNTIFNASGIVIDQVNEANILNNHITTISDTATGVLINNLNNSRVESNTIEGGRVGIRIFDSENLTVQQNRTYAQSVYGIALQASQHITLTRNLTRDLGVDAKPIHLGYDQPTPSNNAKAVPVFSYVTYKLGELVIRGEAKEGDRVEIFTTDEEGIDMLEYRTAVTADRYGQFEYRINIVPSQINQLNLRATATESSEMVSGNVYTSEASVHFSPDLKICYVTTKQDIVDGSFRYNINKANNNECNLMLFEIPVSSDYRLSVESDLPEISAQELTIDATSQAGFNGVPIITLKDDITKDHALSIHTQGGIYVHGMRFEGYQSPVQIVAANYFENSISDLIDYSQNPYRISSTSHEAVRIDSNTIQTSIPSTGIHINAPKVFFIANRIDAGTQHALHIENDSILCQRNTIARQSMFSEGTAILITNSDTAVVRDNKVDGYRNGVKAHDTYKVGVYMNRFNTDTLHHQQMMAVGMEVFDAEFTEFSGNYYFNADTGAYVHNCVNVLCGGSVFEQMQTLAILAQDADTIYLQGNEIKKTPLGIHLHNLTNSEIDNNLIHHYDSLGMLIDGTTQNCIVSSNIIGSESEFSPNPLKAVGVLILASENTIGGAENKGNTINFNLKGGVIVDGGTSNTITYNRIFGNDTTDTRPSHFAIEHRNNGNLLKSKPEITAASTLEKNKRYLVSGIAEPNDSVHLYRSDGYYQSAYFFTAATKANAQGEWQVLVDTAVFKRPLRYETFTMVATATDEAGNTSELSDILYVGTCYVTNTFDNDDNEYPEPNSLRQAVACANMQTEKTTIHFAINMGGPKVIPLHIKMIDLNNTFGTSFDGENIYDKSTVTLTNGMYDPDNAVKTFWEIGTQQGTSDFSNFKITNFEEPVHFKAPDSITVRKFAFELVSGKAMRFVDGLRNYTFDSLQCKQSVSGTYIHIEEAVENFVIKNSSFEQGASPVYLNGVKDLALINNTIKNCLNPVLIENSENVEARRNTFDMEFEDTPAMLWNSTSGKIESNTFSDNTAGTPLLIHGADHLHIIKNEFTDSSAVCISITDSDTITIHENKINGADRGMYLSNVNGVEFYKNTTLFTSTAFYLEEVNDALFEENTINGILEAGIDLRNSDHVKITKNTIIGFSDELYPLSQVKAINLHLLNTDLISNQGKPTPAIGGYELFKEEGLCYDDGEETRVGIFLYGTAEPFDKIEIFFADSLYRSLESHVVDADADSTGYWRVRIPRDNYHKEPEKWYHFTVTATDSNHRTSEVSQALRFGDVTYPVLVKNLYNEGPFTLRTAVDEINCSDVFTIVYFQIDTLAPYEIHLTDDTLRTVSSFLGFRMNGVTQTQYERIKQEDPQLPPVPVAITHAILPDDEDETYPFMRIAPTSTKGTIANLTFKNMPRAIANYGEVKFNNLYIHTENEAMRGDTALLSYGSTSVDNTLFEGYKVATHVSRGSIEAKNNRYEHTTVNLVLEGENVANSIISENEFYADSVCVLITETNKPHQILANHFGDLERSLQVPGVLIYNSNFQYIGENIVRRAESSLPQDTSIAVFMVLGTSSNNSIINNSIGLTDDGDYVGGNRSSMYGVWVNAYGNDTLPSNNSIINNQFMGLTDYAIVLDRAIGATITNNYLGVDTLFRTRGANPEPGDYSNVPGIDKSGVLVRNTSTSNISNNVIVNFGEYGIDVQSSDLITMQHNRIFSTKSDTSGIYLNLYDEALVSNGGIKAPEILNDDVLTRDLIKIEGRTDYPNARIHLFQSFDTKSQALRFLSEIQTGADGNWTIELPSENFGFSEMNSFVAQVTINGNSSQYSQDYTINPLLCRLAEKGINLLEDEYNPCPQSQFTISAQLVGLQYEWLALDQEFDTITTIQAKIDKTARVRLTLRDNFECKHIEEFYVNYKESPVEPNFIVASQNYVSDTIVVVDVSTPIPDEYRWSSSDGISILPPANPSEGMLGEDGKTYPIGREVRFIAPAPGEYTIEQRSVRDGCFTLLTKTVMVEDKDPDVENPYALNTVIRSLEIYPSPMQQGATMNAFITMSNPEEVVISIINNQGQELKDLERVVSGSTRYNVSLPVSELEPDMYLIRVSNQAGVMTYKIVIQ